MWPPGYGARRWAAGASCRAAAGPAMTTLRSVAARIARTVRCVAIAYIVVQVVIWHSFYAADPWRLAGSSPGASTALLLAIAAANLCGRRMLYRRATGADIALAQADSDAREQYVVLSRNIERREHERLLHDTVLNTLTALARPGSTDAGEVVGLCRRDVTLMEYVLSDPGDPAEEAGRAYGALLTAIEAIATGTRARRLAVHVDVADGVPAGAGGPGGA